MCAFKQDSSRSSRSALAIVSAVAAIVPPVVLFAPRHMPDAAVGLLVGTLLGIGATALIAARKA